MGIIVKSSASGQKLNSLNLLFFGVQKKPCVSLPVSVFLSLYKRNSVFFLKTLIKWGRSVSAGKRDGVCMNFNFNCGNNINAQQAQASRSLSSFHSPTPWFARWFYSYRMLAAQCNLPLLIQTESASPWLHVSVMIAVAHTLLNKSQEVGNLCVYIKASGWSWVMLHVNVLHKTVLENFEISWEEILTVIDAESSVEHLFFEGKPLCWEDYVSWR